MTEVRMIYERRDPTTRVLPHTHLDATPRNISGSYTELDAGDDVYGLFTPKNGFLELSYVESAE